MKTVSYGLESNPLDRSLDPKIWKLVPNEVKELTSIERFKSLKFEHCLLNLCKNYIFIYIIITLIKCLSPLIGI